MKRKLMAAFLAMILVLSLAACSSGGDEGGQADTTAAAAETTAAGTEETAAAETPAATEAGPVVETFSAEYEMVGTTSAGLPKNDTFIFEGETTDGIITSLNFDIIRNKGLEGEYSKKDLMGYQMNVSDAEVAATDNGFELVNLGMNGYETEFGQYMITATCPELTDDTVFGDLTITNYTGEELTPDQRILIYQYLANEADIELTDETPVSELLAIHGLYKDGEFVEGTSRVSFAGFNGGRSYGEQIDAIVDYILNNNMTLEDVYEMFRTVNQQNTPIEDRDTIAGATIAFVGDFQRMVYLAMYGELFEGVTNSTTADGSTTIEVVTQGYGGEIETHVTFDDATRTITAISVRDAQESDGYGAVLTADGSDYLNTLIESQDDLDAVDTATGATTTATSLKKAVLFAKEYYDANN